MAVVFNQGYSSDRSIAQSHSLESSFISSRSTLPGRQPIALIAVHSDPAAVGGQEAAKSHNGYVRQVGEALASLGWQVDMFTRKTDPDNQPIAQHSPYCRTIRLVAGPQKVIPSGEVLEYLPQFITAFQKFQAKEGTNYPLVHTHHWLSAWVGLQLKSNINLQLVHTHHSLGTLKYRIFDDKPPIANTRLAVEQQILEEANCIVAANIQEREQLRSLISTPQKLQMVQSSTEIDSFRLSHLYRRLLAQSIMDERLWQLPDAWELGDSPVKVSAVTSAKSLTPIS
ncbi:MAG TPA: hypothetical protein DDZ80_12370 [Cyanobacteria bacterium UBA8803]|nr:hypothetical protein [Cyanobacteria bacterium UBA9273]HBL59274.1 hypothetical protein [Cyanobacteria bacterium UBA8803]